MSVSTVSYTLYTSDTRREELEAEECTFAPVISERSRVLVEARERTVLEGELGLTSGACGHVCGKHGRIAMQCIFTHLPSHIHTCGRVDEPNAGGGLGGVGGFGAGGAAAPAGDAAAAARGGHAPGMYVR